MQYRKIKEEKSTENYNTARENEIEAIDRNDVQWEIETKRTEPIATVTRWTEMKYNLFYRVRIVYYSSPEEIENCVEKATNHLFIPISEN